MLRTGIVEEEQKQVAEEALPELHKTVGQIVEEQRALRASLTESKRDVAWFAKMVGYVMSNIVVPAALVYLGYVVSR